MLNAKVFNPSTCAYEKIDEKIIIYPQYISLLKNGKVIIISIEENNFAESMINIVEFDPETNKFSKVNQISISKRAYGIGFFDDESIITIGGHNHYSTDEELYKSVELINFYTGKITKLPDIGESMLYPEIIRLKNGKILIIKNLRNGNKQIKTLYEFIIN